MNMKYLFWFFFAFFAIGVGLYPLLYLFLNIPGGLLDTKSTTLLEGVVWNAAFYQHILFGGLALLVGWPQFSEKIRKKTPSTHRFLGKIYVFAVFLSGIASLYIACYATGGLVSALGFGTLGVVWLWTTSMAYLTVRKGNIQSHQNWMIRSYALCFAAVTLRIWLPLMAIVLQMDFLTAYQLVAWLCWVPNWAIAEILVYKSEHRYPAEQVIPGN